MRSVSEILDARNVVVIGASRNPGKPGALLLKVLRETGFRGRMAGVNPEGGEVYGVSLFRGLEDVPFEVDLAVLLIPPPAVPQALRVCARKGVKGVVISSEGFAEAGQEGRRIQEEVREILRTTGMRGFGPNTLGLVNTSTGLTTSYFANERMLRPGSIGLAAQSGIFVGALLRYLSSFEGLQLSKGLGLGNKVDVDEAEALYYLADDEQTRIIGLYLEDVRDGHRFLDAARYAVERKPVILLKGGRSSAGARAVASHTASLAVDDKVLDGALRQCGVLRVPTIDALVNTLLGFQWMPLPRGPRIALVTYSGAQAILSIDRAEEVGLELARFSEETQRRISKVISSPSKSRNPVDLFPDMMVHGFEKTSTEILRALLDGEEVHGVIFISFALQGAAPYEPVVELLERERPKPVFFTLLGTKEDVDSCRAFLERHRVPSTLFPEAAVEALARMWRYARIRRQT